MTYVKSHKFKKQYSDDQGITWYDVAPAEYAPSGEPIGYYDTLEECMAQYRTIQSGTTCVGVDKHNQDVYEVSYDEGVTWSVVSTSAGTLIETNSYDCGYRTRTTSGTAYCTGYDKYVDVYRQVSTDYGNTWTTTATTPTLVELNSEDCGYIPPQTKYKLTLNDTSTVSAECDSTSSITQAEISAYTSTTVSAEIGDCVTSIDKQAFYFCGELTAVTIGTSVTSIGFKAFRNCTSLTSVTIPDSVTTIGHDAFANCYGLININIPSGVTSISNLTFGGCTSLASIVIPSGVTSIGENAFVLCSSLTSITVNATTPPTLGSGAFDYTSSNLVIYVPSGSVNAYKSASGWSTYASRIQAIP